INVGRNGVAAAGSFRPRRRSSLTSRSCNVPLARSTRPLASGLRAQRGAVLGAREGGGAGAPNRHHPAPPRRAVAGLNVEDTQPVAVERHRLAMSLEVAAGRAEVV